MTSPPSSIPGPLVAIGGAEDRKSDLEILKRVFALAPEGNHEIAVIATASSIPDQILPDYEAAFSRLGASRAVDLVERLFRGVPVDRITMSSDCNGSLPEFDARGTYIGMRVAGNTTLITDWQRLIREGVLPMEQAIDLISGNVARVLGLQAHKGRLAVGHDADVTLLDSDLQPRQTFIAGRRVFGTD